MEKLNRDMIARLWRKGLSDSEIAEKMNTYQSTVCNIRKKLKLRSNRTTQLTKEINKHGVIFRNEYTGEERRRVFSNEYNNVEYRKIVVRILKMPNGITNFRKRVIYCRVGDEEKAFKEYMSKLSTQIKQYFKIADQNTRTRRINNIRNCFGLNKVNGIQI